MVRRLIDQSPRREQRRQVILLDRLEVGFRNRIKAELSRAMLDMVLVYEHTGEVPPARDHVDRLTAMYQAMAIATMTVFGGRVVQQGKSSGQVFETKGFAETMARIALGYIAGELLRRRITNVAETTRQQIVNAVDRGYQDGLGQFGVAKLVREAVPSMSTFRSALIARTETHGAANYGAFAAADETGLLLDKEWISAEDERTREDHALANGQIVGKDEAFDVGGEAMMYPGDPAGSAANVVNCRCALGWVVRDSIQAATSPIEAQAVHGAQFTYQEFKPSKNIKEATARMTGTVADRVDLPPGAKVQMVNETHSAMLEVQERFALGPAAFVGNHKKAGPRYSWNSSAAAAFDMKRDYYLGAAKAFNYDMLDAGIEVSHATKGTHYKAATKVLAERGVHFGDDFVSIFAKMDPSEYKWAIPNTPKDIAFHELGHRLHSKVMPEISGIFPNGTFAPQWGLLISRYAQTSTEELVAESFALYMQGNKSQFFRIYPPLLRLFERMDKKAK